MIKLIINIAEGILVFLVLFILKLMGKKVDLNLNHLKAIISYADKIHFKGLLKMFLISMNFQKIG